MSAADNESVPSYGTLTRHGDHLGPCMACWNEGIAQRLPLTGSVITLVGRPGPPMNVQLIEAALEIINRYEQAETNEKPL